MLLLNWNIDQLLKNDSLPMMILGPVHASIIQTRAIPYIKCMPIIHTISCLNHDAKYMSKMNHEQSINHVHPVPYHVPTMHITMYINHVHQHHTIYHKISSMKCINHMPRTCANCVLSMYQYHQQMPLTILNNVPNHASNHEP
jgi:hypothetical protein